MEIRFQQDRHSDDGICAVERWDLVKFGLGNGNRIPPSGPSSVFALHDSRHLVKISDDSRMCITTKTVERP